MKKVILIIFLMITASICSEGKPSVVKVDAIKYEWLQQIANIARSSLKKYGPEYATEKYLSPDDWKIANLILNNNGLPETAVLFNEIASIRFKTQKDIILSQLTIYDSSGDVWIFYFRIVDDQVKLDKQEEGWSSMSQPREAK